MEKPLSAPVSVKSSFFLQNLNLLFFSAVLLFVYIPVKAAPVSSIHKKIHAGPLSNNASLSNLGINQGVLSPVFTPSTISYTTSVPNAISAVIITPVTAEANAKIKVNGIAVISGNPSASIPLVVGANLLTTIVTAADSVTKITYTLTITRLGTVPIFSYSGPQSYVVSSPVTPLQPSSIGIAGFAYSSTPGIVGSGFTNPTGVAADIAGNIYVADYGNNSIKMIPANGGATVTIASGFNQPTGIAVDAAGNVYVGDMGNNAVKKIPAGGGAPVIIGSGFSLPAGVAVDAAGNVYVGDSGNKAVKKIPVGGGVPVIIGSGFNNPYGVAVDIAGNVYVADIGNNALMKIPAGGGAPFAIGSGFNLPIGVTVDASGNIYVADYGNNAIKRIPGTGGATVTIGSGFSHPYAIAEDAAGNVYVADYGNSAIKQIKPVGGLFISPTLPAGLSFSIFTGVISGTSKVASPATNYTVVAYNANGGSSATVNIEVKAIVPVISYTSPATYLTGVPVSPVVPANFGVAALGYNGTGVTIATGFHNPQQIALDTAGNLYVDDSFNSSIKKIPAGGGLPVTLISGVYAAFGVAVDASGNIYVGDSGNKAIRKLPSGGGPLITVATGLSSPGEVAVDGIGNIYLADGGIAIKKIAAGSNTFTTILNSSASGLAVDAYNNLYLSGGSVIRKLIAGSNAITIIGSGYSYPQGIAVDASGNAYVSDVALKILVGGAGTPITIITGADVAYSAGVAVDKVGNIYISNFQQGSVAKFNPVGGYFITPALPMGLTFDSKTGIISGTPAVSSPLKTYTIIAYNVSGFTKATVSIKVDLNLPAIAYSTPHIYNPGAAIAAIVPVSSKVDATGYKSQVNIGSGFSHPTSVAADKAGNIYVADHDNNAVKMIPVGGGTPVALGSGFSGPTGVAVDAAGNVYVGDTGNNAIKMIPAGGGAPVTLGSGFNGPAGVAVDILGNVYVADKGNNAIKMIPVGGGATVVLGSGFSGPFGVAVDATGNVYVGDQGNSAVKKIPAGGGDPVIIGSGFTFPYGVTVDAVGNLYVADYGNNVLKKIPAGGGTPVTMGTGYSHPTGVAVDGLGNIYVADQLNNVIKQIAPLGGYFISQALPTGLNFESTTGIISGTPTAASPATTYIVTAYNVYGSTSAGVNIQIILSPNADINSLDLSGIALTPAFATNTKDYAASVPFNVSSTNVTTSLADANASLQVNGTPVSSGVVYNMPLVVGQNLITALVTAQDGSTKAYTITITRAIQVISLSYAGPKSYLTWTPITPLVPTSTKIDPLAYSSSTVTLGTGFSHPAGVAIDAAGNIYLADYSNNAVKKIPVGGGAPITIGSGFSGPFGVAVDAAGNVYVGDFNNSAVKQIPAGGGAPVVLGSGINLPAGVAVDAAGNVFVAAYGDNAVKRIPVGGGVPVIIGSGFMAPFGVAVDAAGNVYVADRGNNAVKKIPVGGGAPLTLGSGFNAPEGVAVDAAGNVFVADRGNNAIKMIPVGGGVPVTLGSGFNFPRGVAVDIAGIVYAADFNTNSIKQVKPVGGYYLSNALPAGLNFDGATGTISGAPATVMAAANYTVYAYNNTGSVPATVNIQIQQGPPVISYSGPKTYATGTPIAALSPTSSGVASPAYSSGTTTLGSGFSHPAGVAVDAAGNTYVADYSNNAIKKVPVGGGAPITIGSGFNSPFGVAVDAAGNVYVGDFNNNAIKKIPVGGGAPVVLGSGINLPAGVAVDAAGNVFVAAYGDNAVKRIPVGGGVPVIIGSGFIAPFGVAVDAAGNVYVADRGNNAVKKIPVGGGAPVTLGSGFNAPEGVAVDAAGNVFVADRGNNAIKMIPVGGGVPVTLGSGFNFPRGVAVDMMGNVYAADFNTNSIKQVKPAGGYYLSNALPAGLRFDGTTGAISGTPTAVSPAANYTVYAYNTTAGTPATVNIRTVSANASLANLTISSGTLSPVFAAGTFTYNATTSIYRINIIPISADPNATLMVNDTTVSSGSAFYVALSMGLNKITTAVTAPDGTTILRYVVNITRVGPPPAFGYSSPHSYPAGTAISPLIPESWGVDVQAYSSSTITLGSGFSHPAGVAVDAAGNIYVADYSNNAIKKIPVGGGAPVTLGSGFNGPFGVTVDAAGNVYVGDFNNSAVKKIPIGGGAPVTLGSGINLPAGIAVDAAGNVFVAAYGDNALKKIPVGGGAPVIIGSGFIAPFGVAVDAAGNVYVADRGNNAVKKIPVGGGAPLTLGSGFNAPEGVAVDAAGNVFVADRGNNAIKMIPVGGGAPVTLGSGFNFPRGVALDRTGNVYAADFNTNSIKQVKPVGGYYLADTLPTGLSLDGATGTISGTPTTLTAAANYTVYAYNSTGGTPAVVNINVSAFVSFAVVNAKSVTHLAYTVYELRDDLIKVHQAVSPNGDGINDVLLIDNIVSYPDNKLTLFNSSGTRIFEATGYDNANKVFDGHSNITGTMQRAGTYYYQLDYQVTGELKHATGYFIIKY